VAGNAGRFLGGAVHVNRLIATLGPDASSWVSIWFASRTSSTASFRLARASSRVAPCVFAPKGVLPSRFVNSTINQLADAIAAHREYAWRVCNVDEADASRVVQELRRRLTVADAAATSDPEAWWSLILEQAEKWPAVERQRCRDRAGPEGPAYGAGSSHPPRLPDDVSERLAGGCCLKLRRAMGSHSPPSRLFRRIAESGHTVGIPTV
jgi:hypothetical protein